MATLLTYALCTVADVKELLGIASGDSSKNELIIRKINLATRWIENYTSRRFQATNYTEDYDGTGTDELVLRNRPLISVTSLSARDTSLNQDDFTAVDSQDYFSDLNAGILTGIGAFYGRNNIWRVVYRAGYETIPEDVAEACATLAAYMVQNPTGAGAGTGIKRQREGQREIEYQNNNQMNQGSLIEQLGLDDILASYAEPRLSGLR